MILDDFADCLSSAGHGVTGTDLFKSMLPSRPDAVIGLIHYGGLEPVRGMAGSAGQALAQIERVQVIVRNPRYEDAAKLAQDVWFTLDGASRAINGVQYQWISALQSPFFLGRDENNRSLVACNFECVRDTATSS